MKKIDKLLWDSEFRNAIDTINTEEINRVYCRHGFEHLLAVARICYILNVEEKLGHDKEMIYAMALLHDIGRVAEYDSNGEVDHRDVGPEYARPILERSGFTEEEIEIICDAILKHGVPASDDDKGSLADILYRADKLSRNCFDCTAYGVCKWKPEVKNNTIEF